MHIFHPIKVLSFEVTLYYFARYISYQLKFSSWSYFCITLIVYDTHFFQIASTMHMNKLCYTFSMYNTALLVTKQMLYILLFSWYKTKILLLLPEYVLKISDELLIDCTKYRNFFQSPPTQILAPMITQVHRTICK